MLKYAENMQGHSKPNMQDSETYAWYVILKHALANIFNYMQLNAVSNMQVMWKICK